MADREGGPLSSWFGKRSIVRLMLLAALLTLGVIHFQWLIGGVLFLWSVASPVIAGAVIAYILEVVIKRLEKVFFPKTKIRWLARSRRWICIALSAILVVMMVVLIVYTVIPGLTQAVTLLARELPVYFQQLKSWTLETFHDVPAVTEFAEGLEFDWQSIQDRAINWALNGVGGSQILSSTVTVIGAVTGKVANFLISAIFAIFLLSSKDKLQRQYHRLMNTVLSEKKNEKIQHVLDTANRCFSGFIVGQSLNGLLLGVFTWLGMRIFGMPYALVVGVLSGTTSLIPIIGGYIGAALGTFLVFTADPRLALWFLLFIIVLQTLQGNIIYPRMVGSSVGIPSLWVLAAVSVGGGLGGLGGMLLAVPVTATVYALVHEWVLKKEAGPAAGPPASQEEA